MPILPTRKVHSKLDERLKEDGIICIDTNTEKVHDRIDRDVKKFGAEHRDLSDYHNEEGVRWWINKWSHLASQDTKTDYLRIALGHLTLDEVASNPKNRNKSEEGLIQTASRTFKRRGYHRKFFRERRYPEWWE